ncbi:MAG: YdeI/OmpD-associated family protein [Pseudomonadota bacterium]
MISDDRYEQVLVESAGALRNWLGAHHAQEDSVWLVTYKKEAGDKYLSRLDVLDELIAFGWIDGIRRKRHDAKTMQLISRRRQQAWAASYKARAARLTSEGRMAAPGLASIKEAKASGLWNAQAEVDALLIPEDLHAALRARQTGDRFGAMAPSYRRNVLRWLAAAKRDATRQKRIVAIVEATTQGQKIPQM